MAEATPNGHAIPVRIDGVGYPSARHAAAATGISTSALHFRLHSPDFPGYELLGPPGGMRIVANAQGPAPRAFAIARPIEEPRQWAFDGYERRAAVVDPDTGATVRRVGWLRCLRCMRPMFSDDVVAIRSCFSCGGLGSRPLGGKPAHLRDLPDIREHSPVDEAGRLRRNEESRRIKARRRLATRAPPDRVSARRPPSSG